MIKLTRDPRFQDWRISLTRLFIIARNPSCFGIFFYQPRPDFIRIPSTLSAWVLAFWRNIQDSLEDKILRYLSRNRSLGCLASLVEFEALLVSFVCRKELEEGLLFRHFCYSSYTNICRLGKKMLTFFLIFYIAARLRYKICHSPLPPIKKP